ncbi:MAG: glycosyltransferase [Planctomycetota bacterium]
MELCNFLNRRIRVMHVFSTWAMGGSERMLTHLIPNFDESRFESCLVCFNSPSFATREWEAAGIRVIYLNMDKLVSVRGSIRIYPVIRDFRPDVLMVWGLRANLMTRFVAGLCRVPVLISPQRGVEEWKGRLAVFLEKATSVFVDMYIGNAKACCEMLAKRERIPRRKLHVIPNGIDFRIPDDAELQVEELKKQYHIPSDHMVIGTVGRLHPIKGHEFLIQAAQLILKEFPKTVFIFLGKDVRNGELQNMVLFKGLQDKILFPGYSKDVAVWLKCFDIFVLPSLSEGMPVSVLEAMYCALPVVATDVGGVAEVVVHQETGILVPPADPVLLAKEIKYLLNNPERRDILGQNGRNRAEKNFTVEIMVKNYQDIFVKLLSEALSKKKLPTCA